MVKVNHPVIKIHIYLKKKGINFANELLYNNILEISVTGYITNQFAGHISNQITKHSTL